MGNFIWRWRLGISTYGHECLLPTATSPGLFATYPGYQLLYWAIVFGFSKTTIPDEGRRVTRDSVGTVEFLRLFRILPAPIYETCAAIGTYRITGGFFLKGAAREFYVRPRCRLLQFCRSLFVTQFQILYLKLSNQRRLLRSACRKFSKRCMKPNPNENMVYFDWITKYICGVEI